MNANLLRRAPAPLASDNLKVSGGRWIGTHDNWLHQSFSADRFGKFSEFVVAEIFAWVERTGFDLSNRHHALLAFGR